MHSLYKHFLSALLIVYCTLLLGVHFSQAKEAVALKEGILLAAFGTSVPEARPALEAVEKAFRMHAEATPLEWTYTSQIIRKKLAKEGQMIKGISQALESLAKAHVQVVRIQPLHVMAGEEFSALERAVLLDIQKHPGRFAAVYLGRPLLESREDAIKVGKALLLATKERRTEKTALVLMGHGQEHGRAGLVFEGVRQTFMELDPMLYMATVEGQRDFASLLQELKEKKVSKVLLRPLMVVAGDHARNDLAGEEPDSWASQLKKAGISVDVDLEGLGSVPEVDALYLEHAFASKDDLTKEPRKQ